MSRFGGIPPAGDTPDDSELLGLTPPREPRSREAQFRDLHPYESAVLYRWLPVEGDCIRHHGPHEGFRCSGARGRLVEVRAEEVQP